MINSGVSKAGAQKKNRKRQKSGSVDFTEPARKKSVQNEVKLPLQKQKNKKEKLTKVTPASEKMVSDTKNAHKRKAEQVEQKKSFKKSKVFKAEKGENESFVPKTESAVMKQKGLKIKERTEKGETMKKSSEKASLLSMKKKERRAFRQKSKKNFELAKQLKMLWEELRRDNITEERKSQLLKQTSTLVKGNSFQLIFAHDTVRAIECLVAQGTEEHRTMLFEELKDHIILLAKSRYAKFFVIKILRYGTQDQKNCIIKAFHSKVIHLMRHKEAAVVVETAFNECANSVQRTELVQEFYGPHFLYFKESNFHKLAQFIEAKPEQKTSIILHLKTSLERVLEKGAHKYSIIHYVLREFMAHADSASCTELIESLQKVAAEILHTKDGSRVVMNCIWQGSTKARKVIVKNFRNHVAKIAQEEYGHMTLLAIFDCVDDTKLVEKHIISEIVKDSKPIFLNQYGRKVVAYLVNPRNPTYFHPDVINILKQGDNNTISKKDSPVRISELQDYSSPPLLKFLVDNLQELLADNACCLLVFTILKHATGDRTQVFQALAKLASEPYFPPVENLMHFIEAGSSSLVLKKLVTADKDTGEDKNDSFSVVFVNEIPHGNFSSWIECNRGAFLLVNLLETRIPSVVERIREELMDQKKDLACKSYVGAKILLKILNKVD